MRSSEIANVIGIAPLVPIGTTYNVFRLSTPSLSAPSAAAVLPIPGTMRLNRRRFLVTLSGFASPAVPADFQLAIYAGTDTNPANNVLVAELGATPMGTGGNFFAELDLIQSNDIPILQGTARFFVGGGGNFGPAALGSAVAIADNKNEPVLNLVAAASFSVANAGSKIVLDTFAVEA